MAQRFYQGRTNNHLTFAMVDATDFATPESALSAAATIKIYGKLKGATGVNFVTSGTGSLTNDIQHVGASATGVYTIALAKADLSDASAAWYDQYTVILAGTGAAQQVLVIEGVLTGANVSDLSALVSDIQSLLVVANSNASDAASHAALASSRVLLVQSRLSDLDSRFTSDVSDILSGVRGNSDALSDILSRINSASFLSDIASNVWAAKYTANSAASSFGSLMSDIYSRAGGAVTASDISDIASAVNDILASRLSDILSAAVQTNSRILVVQSLASDAHSAAVVAQSISASDMSDLRSAITGVTATVTASDISDIASAVRTTLVSDLSDILSAAVQTNSRTLVIQSMVSDVDSALTSQLALSNSEFSDIRSMLVVIDDLLDTEIAGMGIKINTALAGFEFLMVLASDHISGGTGLTVTGEVSKDGAAFGALTNAVAEVANGIYKIDLAAGDVNAAVLTLKFTAATADTRFITIKTHP